MKEELKMRQENRKQGREAEKMREELKIRRSNGKDMGGELNGWEETENKAGQLK
jgi:hypothetical protein